MIKLIENFANGGSVCDDDRDASEHGRIRRANGKPMNASGGLGEW